MASEAKSHLGIPQAVFMEDVDAYMKSKGSGETTESVLKHLDEQHQKYKYLEMNLLQKKLRLKNQVPDIKQSLDIIRHMQKKMDSTEPLKTHFMLQDNLYARATIAPTDRVCLWLGANVMLEYEVNEARSLLERNLDTATRNMEQLGNDLDFLRDQFTTTEVNVADMARVYNWDVKRRQAESKQHGGTA